MKDLIPFIIAAWFVLLAWAVLDDLWLVTYPGRPKHGVTVWRELLPSDIPPMLSPLSNDIIQKNGYIRRQGNAFTVFSYLWGRTYIHYLAHIDLAQPHPSIEYRTSLPMLLLWASFLVVAVAWPYALVCVVPFVALIIFSAHIVSRRAIRDFIYRSIRDATLKPRQS